MINRRVVILAAAALLLLAVIATTQLSTPPRPQPVVVVKNATPTAPITTTTPTQAVITPPCQGVKIETPKLTVCGVIQYDGTVIWAKEGWVKGTFSLMGDTSTCVFDTTSGVYVKFTCQAPVGIIVK